jgi:fructose/tagatose bisphosphate aldolase
MLKAVVHGYDHAVAALKAAAAAGVPARLLSARGAAAYAGPAWFRELVAQACAAVPEAQATALLDCGSRAGDALAAIRAGVPAIAIDLPADAAANIADIATQAGVRIEDYEDAGALDLAACRDTESAHRACSEHLRSPHR